EERARRRSRLVLPLVATVAAALVLLVGAWGWSMKMAADTEASRLDAIRAVFASAPPGSVPFLVKGQSPAADSWAVGLVDTNTNQATLVANNLPILSASQVYELWWLPQQPGKAPVPAGVF